VQAYKTCHSCASYLNCKTYNTHFENIKKLLSPEAPHVKIYRAASTIAEACPEYFHWVG
jgi:hypothetical protein